MDKDTFIINYGINDGYYNSNKSFSFKINVCELEDDMNDDQLENVYDEAIQSNFEEKITPYGKNLDKFKEWARDRIKHWDNE